MSNYSKAVDFASKDALASGNPSKVIKGTEHDTEYNAIAVAIATKADLNSPVLVTPNLGTPSAGVMTNVTGTATALNIGGNAATVTIADAGGDTTTFPLLGTAATGSLAPATDAGLTYNATTNELTTTTFIGNLTGNASGSSGSCTGNAATATDATNLTGSGTISSTTTGTTQAVGTNNTTIATTAFCEAGFVNNDVGVVGVGCILLCYRSDSAANVASGATVAGSVLVVAYGVAGGVSSAGTALSGTWRNISTETLMASSTNAMPCQRIS